MGGSASKSIRKLPTTKASALHPTPPTAPTWSGARPPHLDSTIPPPFQGDPKEAAVNSAGHMEYEQSLTGSEELGQPIGKSPDRFSGNKDDGTSSAIYLFCIFDVAALTCLFL
jgi:hypothetical protein